MADNLKNKELITKPIAITDKDFERLGKYIMSQYGIKMPAFKKIFLQSRLQKRLKELKMQSFKDYIDYIFSHHGQQHEVHQMVDAVSTNTTDFFRESQHFEFLWSHGLTEYTVLPGRRDISLWSAGCASGEEPYSLAMLLREFSNAHPFTYRILATDISDSVLEHARLGIYNIEKINSIPEKFRKNYLLRGTGNYENRFRITPEIRNKVHFSKFNLMGTDYRESGIHDIIFCRNVLIYFEREVQGRILKQLCEQLRPGGYLFLGHSESAIGLSLPLKQLKPTIYLRMK
jgi:chemotaxis protein methyltransferase CheR